MATLIKEERYILQIGTEECILRVQELVRGNDSWPEKCRIHMLASPVREAKRFYGATTQEVVDQAAKYLAAFVAGQAN